MADFFRYNGIPHYMQSEEFADYMAFIGWRVHTVQANNRQNFLFSKKLPIFGTLAKSPKVLYPFPLKQFAAAIERDRPIVLRIEPNMILPGQSDLAKYQSQLAKQQFVDTWLGCELKTLRFNVQNSEQTIFKSLPRENTRRNIRQAASNKLRAEEIDDLKLFYKLHVQSAKQRHFYCPPFAEMERLWQNFKSRKQATIVIIRSKKGEPLAGVLLITFAGVAYYRYVGASPQAFALRAPSLAVWESILTAKRHGCDWFDFYGVNDERSPLKAWQGFTHFKEGFSNTALTFVTPAAKYYAPVGPVLKLFDRII